MNTSPDSASAKRKMRDSLAGNAHFLLHESVLRFNRRVSLCLFGLALAVYGCTVVPSALAGEPAETLASVLGLVRVPIARHAIWRACIRFVAALSPSHAVLSINLFCTIVSAATVGLMHLFFSQFLAFLLDDEHYRARLHGDPTTCIMRISAAGGAAAALVLAFSAPYWFAATQAYSHSFYLGWILLAGFFLVRYAVTFRPRDCMLFCLLWGVGMAQTSCFMAWAPIVFLFVLWLRWSDETLTLSSFFSFCAWFFGPFILSLVLDALFFRFSAVHAELAATQSYWKILYHLFRALPFGIIGSIPTAWWMILLGLCVLPWLAAMLVAQRALNGEGGPAMTLLHIAIAITSILVILDLPFSPWQFYNIESLQILPYAMMALSFGYSLSAALSRIAFTILPSRGPVFAKRWNYLALVVAAALIVFSVVNNAADADLRTNRVVWRYIDTVLDGLRGRTWLATNGVFDNALRVRARERGIPLHTINISDPNINLAIRDFRRDLPSVRLRNVAEIGQSSLLKEWITQREDAPANIALTCAPDFWHMNAYEACPVGLVFHGIPREEVSKAAEARTDLAFLDLVEAFDADLAAVGDDPVPRLRYYAASIRRFVSLFGNNTAFLLESNGHREEAFRLYDRLRFFDPDNVSVLLNWATLIQQGLRPDLRPAVLESLDAFQKKFETPPEIWALSTYYGYVSAPAAFTRMGWTWALSGQNDLALFSLNKAIEDADEAGRARIRMLMADVYLRDGDFENSEQKFLEVLREDPGDQAALLGLVRLNVLRGRLRQADEYLGKAEAAGVPPSTVLYERIALALASQDLDNARLLATRLHETSPGNAAATGIYASVLLQVLESSKEERERETLVKRLRKLSDELVSISGNDDFRAMFVRGRLAVAEGRYYDAREAFLTALKNTKGADPLPVMNLVLHMDYQLMDKASARFHARGILARDPDHSFANYILGSLALESEHLESAKDFFERALVRSPEYTDALNDLAMTELYLHRPARAEELIRKALEKNRGNYGVWDTLGCVFLARADYEAARDAFKESLSLFDADPRVHLHLAVALHHLGDLNKVREIFLRLAPVANTFQGPDARYYAELASRPDVRTR